MLAAPLRDGEREGVGGWVRGGWRMTEGGQGVERVENRKRGQGESKRKGIGGRDDRRRPERYSETNESKRERNK